MTTTIHIDEIGSLVGKDLGFSDWYRVDQEHVNQFADATGDHQWIHIDPERAKDGPFGGTIAHGYFTLALLPVLLPQLWTIQGTSMGVHYGANKVRFPSPVPVGSEVRLGATLLSAEEVGGGIQLTIDTAITVRDAAKPSCVAQVVFRYFR